MKKVTSAYYIQQKKKKKRITCCMGLCKLPIGLIKYIDMILDPEAAESD